jgi:hypothetical protein
MKSAMMFRIRVKATRMPVVVHFEVSLKFISKKSVILRLRLRRSAKMVVNIFCATAQAVSKDQFSL